MAITLDTSIDDVKKMPVFSETASMFQGRCDGQPHDEDGKTIHELHAAYSFYNPESVLHGLEGIEDLYQDHKRHVYPVYSEDETAADPVKTATKLLYYPGDPRKPFVIVIAGGAYMAVCSLAEGFPVAETFHRKGYPAFVLNYRTSTGQGTPYFPIPLDDLAAALKFIFGHSGELGLENLRYGVAGFSAGSNLTNTWGLKRVGYGAYRLPAPDILFCNYTVADLFALEERQDFFLEIMFGKGYHREMLSRYDVLSNMTREYPSCYITAALDDDTVPVSQSQSLAHRLSELGIAHQCEFGKSGGHGYGEGRGTPLSGWIQRGIHFWDQL